MSTGSDWYRRPDAIVDGLRRNRAAAPLPQIAGYDVLYPISSGGQGVVFAALQRSTRRRVAIKVIHDESLVRAEGRLRFEREVDLAAHLSHPNLVAVFDSGVDEAARPYMVMEHVEGHPLHEYLARDNSGRDARLRIFLAICDGVQYAHRNGVIHRDLKPANVLIDAECRPRVLDFGVARRISSSESALTQSDAFLGTLAYAAPEQVSEESNLIDARADVHALGLILYSMLCDASPYPIAGPAARVVDAIRQQQPKPPTRDRDLNTIVLRALAKSPDRRYQSVDALQADVRRFLNGEPIEARRDSAPYVLAKLAGRHRVATAMAALLLTLVVGFSAAMAGLYRAADAEARKANGIRAFLEDTLASAGPQPGGELTLREVLDEAALYLDGGSGQDPEVSAALRFVIGNSYRGLGLLEPARAHLSAALAQHRDLHGDEHADTARDISALGLVQHAAGERVAAETSLRRALAIRRRLLAPDDPQLRYGLQNLARLLVDTDRPNEALPLLAESVALCEQFCPADDPDAAMARFRLAAALTRAGHLEDAIALHREVLAARQARFPSGHPDIEESLLAWGSALGLAGRTDEACEALAECLERRTARLGPDDERTLEAAERLRQLQESTSGE